MCPGSSGGEADFRVPSCVGRQTWILLSFRRCPSWWGAGGERRSGIDTLSGDDLGKIRTSI